MSRLAVDKDDHPEAARKHFHDAHVLKNARRFDGAAYHAGYVVECSLKSVILHDRSYEPTTGATDQVKLQTWHTELCRKRFGHDLAAILAAGVGAGGARYLPLLQGASVLKDWTEAMRYRAPGDVDETRAQAYLNWAELAVVSVVQMQLDGVI